MKATDKFLIATALTAALTWGSLKNTFAQNATNDNSGQKIEVTNASYKAPTTVTKTADGFEILPGKTTDAQDRAKKDGVLGISIYYGQKAKYTAEQIAELLGKRLQELGLTSKEAVFYIEKPENSQAGAIEIYIPPGHWFQETVMRNGKPVPKVGTFSASEAYKVMEVATEKYKTAKFLAANQTASTQVTLDHQP